MSFYWLLVITHSDGEVRNYCYVTEPGAYNALAVMEARGAKGIVRKQYVGG